MPPASRKNEHMTPSAPIFSRYLILAVTALMTVGLYALAFSPATPLFAG